MYLLLIQVAVVIIPITACIASVIIDTNYGRLSGRKIYHKTHGGTHVYSFKGIPYAQKLPSSFSKAQKCEGWNGIREAIAFQPSCPNTGHAHTDKTLLKVEYEESLDCLYLNIYTPSLPSDEVTVSRSQKLLFGEPPYPVLVYFTNDLLGQHFEPIELVAGEKVLVVIVNYRSSPAGYVGMDGLSNLALRDQRLALEWIQSTIHSFHGDGKRVTLIGNGESAVTANLHMFSHISSQLFSRVWLSSGSLLSPNSVIGKDESKYNIASFLSAMECNKTGGIDTARCVGELTEDRVTDWYTEQRDRSLFTKPCVDGDVVADTPPAMYRKQKYRKDVDIVMGFPRFDGCEESRSQAPLETSISSILDKSNVKLSKEAYENLVDDISEVYAVNEWRNKKHIHCDIRTDALLTTPMLQQTNIHSNKSIGNTGKVYLYEYLFSHNIKNSSEPNRESTRGDDLWSVLGVPCSKYLMNERGCAISRQMMTYLANFMRKGDPNSPATSHIWPPYRSTDAQTETKLLSVIDPSFSRVVRNFQNDKIEVWNRYLYSSLMPHKSSYDVKGGSEGSKDDVDLENVVNSETRVEQSTEEVTHENIEAVHDKKIAKDEL